MTTDERLERLKKLYAELPVVKPEKKRKAASKVPAKRTRRKNTQLSLDAIDDYEPRREPEPPVPGANHGTATGYSTSHCRCIDCRRWAAAYSRERRARMASSTEEPE